MLTAEELGTRRDEIRESSELLALLDRLTRRADPVLQRMPVVPRVKAMLSVDGGVCPDDGSRLEFDPWSASSHRCPTCGKQFGGERHDRAWAHYQHLWVAERAAHLAALAAFAEREDAASRARELLRAYAEYREYPNSDNVLGPSRLFFSTYLESIWITSYLAAASMLRDSALLDEDTAQVVSTVADEAANIIGEFDEGFSNRQTWHNAALAAIAVWFEDEELASRAIEGSTGMVAHLLRGFGDDGMWYEGDNYHLFALRGQLLAMGWARQAGVDLLADRRLAERLALALRAPALTALPDYTFPARKDSRFGVSLAQPMYLELWEVGLARLAGLGGQHDELWSWLQRLYGSPAPKAQVFDSYLHEAGEPVPPARTRTDLSWWALLEMAPDHHANPPVWAPGSSLILGQGLAVFRQGDRYVGVECGSSGGGHGHPDRLNLMLHADGEYWLPDFGTGSYVARDLFWYRSTLAHNAPRLDGMSQTLADAQCESFDVAREWGWVRGRFGDLSRTVVAGPRYLLDVLEMAGPDERLVELPWHFSGRVEVESAGRWDAGQLPDEFVKGVERFLPASSGADSVVLRVRGATGTLGVHLSFQGELLRAMAPGAPGAPVPVPFYLVRGHGKGVRFVSVLESAKGIPVVRGVRTAGGVIEVQTATGTDHHTATVEGWEVRTTDETVSLRGMRRAPAPFVPTVVTDRPLVAAGSALPLSHPPALDGTLDGFDTREPLSLDHEDQYRRSEEPYPGPEEFSATAHVNWDEHGLYLAVEVTKPDVIRRDPGALPLGLDNEPDEIHADGIQVYLRSPLDDATYGWLIVPSTEDGALMVRSIFGTGEAVVRGGWAATDSGYALTVGIALPGWEQLRPGEQVGFDLLVNQMLPGRQRRAGQLAWSGGGGWVWLRGDRQDPSRFGIVQLR
jgi:Heparinase II/III-like protein/Alginate lyase/Carbohydrate family 9 binding domain-like